MALDVALPAGLKISSIIVSSTVSHFHAYSLGSKE